MQIITNRVFVVPAPKNQYNTGIVKQKKYTEIVYLDLINAFDIKHSFVTSLHIHHLCKLGNKKK